MPGISVFEVSKRYAAHTVLDRVSFDISEGELVSLLGPSGCGKTSVLRAIAGFLTIDSGHILTGGKNVTSLPPHKRNIGFGFQNYALFPHLTVAQNVAFGLEMRKIARSEIGGRVKDALERVHLPGFEDRFPKQLSGGQQQRVALARALVIRPDVLLLDEPLSNLDAKLREEMKNEIREIQKTSGITTIFVTHDRDEAIAISDRMAVMRNGRIEQMGTPEEIFERPSSRFAADFMGITNLIPGQVVDASTIRLSSGDLIKVFPATHAAPSVELALRPERIAIAREAIPQGANVLESWVEHSAYKGLAIDYRVKTKSGLTLTVREPVCARGQLGVNQPVRIFWLPDDALVVPSDKQ